MNKALRLSVSSLVCDVLFVPRGTNIFFTQERGGDKYLLHTGGRGGQTYFTHRGGQKIMHQGGDKHFYIEGKEDKHFYIGEDKHYMLEAVDLSEANFLVSEANIFVNEASKLSTGVRILGARRDLKF